MILSYYEILVKAVIVIVLSGERKPNEAFDKIVIQDLIGRL